MTYVLYCDPGIKESTNIKGAELTSLFSGTSHLRGFQRIEGAGQSSSP